MIRPALLKEIDEANLPKPVKIFTKIFSSFLFGL